MCEFLMAPAAGLSCLNDNRRMPARLSAFLIWALVAASATFWGLRLLARGPVAPAHAVSAGEAVVARGDLSRLLGAPPVAATASVTAPEISSRFRLAGVMAPKAPATQGIALIAVDGKLPRAFRVGAPVDGELVLQSVSLRTAAIGPAQGTTAVLLELPPLPAPATGTLSANAPTPPPAVPPAAQAPQSPPPPRPIAAPPGAAPARIPGQPTQTK
jgi:general secretion pathway protein C